MADATVTLETAPRRVARLRELGPTDAGRRVDCFTLDRSFRKHRAWRTDGADDIIHDDDFYVF